MYQRQEGRGTKTMSKDEKSLQKTQQPIQGLTSDEAARLLEENGYNELAGEKKKSVFIVFFEQVKTSWLLFC